MVVTSVEKFAQYLPLNLQEIFIWYFEQKGVDNPERFLNLQEQQPENNQNLNALLPMIGMLASNQNKTEGKNEPDEFGEFVKELEELRNEENAEGKNEV